MAEGEKNSITAWALLFAPVLVAALLGRIIPAIPLYLTENWQLAIYYGVTLLIGIFLFRSARTEKDHEFHRIKSLKRLSKTYREEDRGLWTKADSAMAQLERDAEGYQARDKDLVRGRKVKEVLREKRTSEIDDDSPKEEVRMLHDEEHVRRSTARMTGDADPMAMMSGAAVEMMKASKGQTNVDDMLAALAEEDKRIEKEKAAATPAPKPQPKPKPEPKPKPKPQPKPQVGGGEMGAAGIDREADVLGDLGASIGGGKSVGRETKICLDCGARNPIGRGSCHNCGASLT